MYTNSSPGGLFHLIHRPSHTYGAAAGPSGRLQREAARGWPLDVPSTALRTRGNSTSFLGSSRDIPAYSWESGPQGFSRRQREAFKPGSPGLRSRKARGAARGRAGRAAEREAQGARSRERRREAGGARARARMRGREAGSYSDRWKRAPQSRAGGRLRAGRGWARALGRAPREGGDAEGAGAGQTGTRSRGGEGGGAAVAGACPVPAPVSHSPSTSDRPGLRRGDARLSPEPPCCRRLLPLLAVSPSVPALCAPPSGPWMGKC